MANNGQSVREELLEVKRRMICNALGLKPKDLRGSLDLAPASISFVLRGERRLTPRERRLFMNLVRRRIDDLFG